MSNPVSKCKTHPADKVAQYCFTCQQFLCLDCCLKHPSSYPDHKAAYIQEIAFQTLKQLEDEMKQIGSTNITCQELRKIDTALAMKIAAVTDTAARVKELILKILDSFVAEQIAVAVRVEAECGSVRRKLDSLGNEEHVYLLNIERVKQLFSQEKFDELIRLHQELATKDKIVSKISEDEKSEFAKKVVTLQ